MTPALTIGIVAAGSGALVGLILGLIGGGGSILAVPLLVYVVGVTSIHVALGTSAVAVSVSALGNLLPHWRAGTIKWRCGVVFAAAGVLGALAGSSFAKMVDGQWLLALFGLVMILVGVAMFMRRDGRDQPEVRLTRATAPRLLPLLIVIGFAVGLFYGFFGIGGGFLIVPGLILATRMPLHNAIGTSLVAVSAFGAATAANYAASGLVDWTLAGLFVAGGLAGGALGARLGRSLAGRKSALNALFSATVILVGLYIAARGVWQLAGMP